MFPLVSCYAIRKAFGSRVLFDNFSFSLSEGQRVGLIGPNGTGKSTLAKILAGLEEADSGTRSLRKGASVSYVAQDSVFESGVSVNKVLHDALSSTNMDELEREIELSIQAGRAGFVDFDADASQLSGGWRKRLAITSALVHKPDVLILDEPTNHLDLEGILWLEQLLTEAGVACLIISHDRYFLEKVSTSVSEINKAYPEGIFSVDGNYSRFLERREEFFSAEAKREDALANVVRREVEWLRRGPKARTTKAKARIDNAEGLISQLSEMQSRARTSTANIEFTGSERKSKQLILAENVGKSFGGRPLFQGINLKLSPGTRLGLSGANGSGKTTLLKILRGDFLPDEGKVERVELLRLVTLDQNRQLEDETVTLKEALAPEGDSVIFRDRTLHVNAWARRFLFPADQLVQPVSRLSGGERARVLIARLMLQPADVLFLDEPTNDLDIPTLEILEENLSDFPGAIVLVTHDRYLLDRVSTQVLGLDGDGGATMYADYAQFEETLGQRKPAKAKQPIAKAPAPASSTPAPKKKLSFKDQREWDAIEEKLHEAEKLLTDATAALHAPETVTNPKAIMKWSAEVEAAQAEVDQLFHRWAELEAKLISS